MQRLRLKVWSHQSRKTGERYLVKDVLASDALTVNSFRGLVKTAAEISYRNPEHVLFFRGQRSDKKKTIKARQVSSFYPSLYRSPGTALTEQEIERRFHRLDEFGRKLLAKLKAQDIAGHDKLVKFPELTWAILQHYEVCATPLIDLTHSLRVAASLALKHHGEDGYVFAFGLPHPNGSITYSVEDELLNIRLLSICPPDAQRPYFQEGFLAGTFPTRRLRKHPSLDLGRRLIAKFRLIKRGFWDKSFQAIPEDALFPKNDVIEDLCLSIKESRDVTSRSTGRAKSAARRST